MDVCCWVKARGRMKGGGGMVEPEYARAGGPGGRAVDVMTPFTAARDLAASGTSTWGDERGARYLADRTCGYEMSLLILKAHSPRHVSSLTTTTSGHRGRRGHPVAKLSHGRRRRQVQ